MNLKKITESDWFSEQQGCVNFLCPLYVQMEFEPVTMTCRVSISTQEVPQSPFLVNVDPSHDAAKVKAEGPGLARTGKLRHMMTSLLVGTFYVRFSFPGVESGIPTHFTTLTKGAGKAPLDVTFSSPVNNFDIIDNYDYSHTVKYTPITPVTQHTHAHIYIL